MVPLRPTSQHLDKEQQTAQLPTSALDTEEGNVLVGGGVPEGVFVVVPKVDLNPPRTGPGKMERRKEEDRCLNAEEP